MFCRCNFVKRESYDCVIAVENEETDWFDVRNLSLYAYYGGMAKSVVANSDESADPEWCGGFAEWAMLTVHALRMELGKSCRMSDQRNA